MGKNTLGEFEEIVMLTVAALYGNAYGVSIKDEIESRFDRKVSIGAMRTALKRLEKKGFIKSEMGSPTAVRGGKRKRFFLVTPYGKQVLEEIVMKKRDLWNSIPKVAFDFKLS